MDHREFVKNTIYRFEPDAFALAKDMLVGEYLSFFILTDEEITPGILSEKVCDYFEKLELKTGRGFEKQLESYLKAVDSIVSRRVVPQQFPQPFSPKKKEEDQEAASRARKYYDKADELRKTRSWKVSSLRDYSRIMFCLYTSIMENDYKVIQNLDYSADCIKPERIIASMKNEIDPIAVNLMKKKLFNIKELYSTDTGTFIIAIIMLYTIVNDRVQGEYRHE